MASPRKKSTSAVRAARAMRQDATMEAMAEDGKLTPLMPANLATPDFFRAGWRKTGRKLFEKCRELATQNDFVESVLGLKLAYFNDRFSLFDPKETEIVGDTPLSKWLDETGYDFERVAGDVWIEYMYCDNVVAFWREGVDGEMPPVNIMDCEDVEVMNVFGEESVKIFPKKVTLSAAQKAALPPRYVDAIMGREGSITLSNDEGEYWRVLKRGKSGGALSRPRLGAILEELSTRDLLELGDWAGAWTMKDVRTQIQKGYKIDSGVLAGDARHHLKKAQQKRILDQERNKGGASKFATNFDVKYVFPFLDPRFFDASKYNGVMARLRGWAGPIEEMRETSNVSPYLLRMFEAEGMAARGKVARFLNSIFNDASFLGSANPPEKLACHWNPHSFKSTKELMEWVRLGSNGNASPQTQREAMGLDNELEGARMKAAAKDKAAYTPPFEPRQGLLQQNQGGRPTDKPPSDTPAN